MVLVQALLARGGREAEPFRQYWSEGAARHEDGGMCRPCHYNYTATGCNNGNSCEYCHLPHFKTKPRPSKPKRQQHRRFRQALDRLLASSPNLFSDAMGAVAEGNLRVRSTLASSDMPTGSPSMRRQSQGGASQGSRIILSL
mmetsp:Transcript_44574/g.129623  ORF Transcript_44574/g.129623 Transcript_44574/m.129623 type:complete len:142 (-) Transcript_44574:143-568(-)